MGKLKDALIYAHFKGYRINEKGRAVNPSGRLLSDNCKRNNYKRFSIKMEGVNVPVYFHRLQAYQKFGKEMLKDEMQVRHLNNNCEDNTPDNIAIGTMSQNMLDIPEVERKRKATIASRAGNTRTLWERACVYKMLADGYSYRRIQKMIGISKGTLSFMRNKSEEYKYFLATYQPK